MTLQKIDSVFFTILYRTLHDNTLEQQMLDDNTLEPQMV